MDSTYLEGKIESLEELEARVSTLETELERVHEIVSVLEPWVGPEGQLRVRLERAEQGLLAVISDPGNPHASAEKARAILTAIPAPPA